MEKPYKVRLQVLSPIHIGCDEVFEPASFKIDKDRGKLIEFNPLDFILSLSPQDKKKFSDICMQGTPSSILDIIEFISQRQVFGREINLVTDIGKQYQNLKTMEYRYESQKNEALNQFIINKTSYDNHNQYPYIPGSSLKGSLRTGYLNMLASIENKIYDDREIEEKLLQGSFNTDPFRMVKISDLVPIENVTTKIVYVVNKKKKTGPNEARGPYQIYEVINEGSVFEGMLNIEKPEHGAEIIKPVKIDIFKASVNIFYKKIYADEKEILEGLGIAPIKINGHDPNAILIRIGRHSGAEAITIEGYRKIKIIQKKGKSPLYLDRSTTLWLTSDRSTTLWLTSDNSKPNTNSGLMPMGWALLTFVEYNPRIPFKRQFVNEDQKNSKNAWIAMQQKASDLSQAEIKAKEKAVLDANSLDGRLKKAISSGNPSSFIEFIKTIQDYEYDKFKDLSIKDLESVNIGLVPELEKADIPSIIKKMAAKKMLEIIKPNKKWNDAKYEKYNKLKKIAE